MVKLDRVTDQRIVTDPYCGDIEYESNLGVSAVDNESVVVYGKWTDKDGSTGGKKAKFNVQSTNKFQGTDPGLEGFRLGNLNAVGQSTDNIRRRRKIRKMESKGDNY